ncbi:MAG: queuosine precursor transporter [Bacilli bacterium]|jgi:hypothetical protein|nr:queuosine precursor transporter [Bacilli bacterium]
MNELLWISILLISLVGIIVFYKVFGKMGLYTWVIMALIVANIQAVKTISLFGMQTNLGIILYSTSFLIINIINEKYGKKTAKNIVLLTLCIQIMFILLMQLGILFKPSVIDMTNENLKLIFNFNIRIFIGSTIAYFISQLCNINLYQLLKLKYNKLWISNGISATISQLLDTFIFMSIAFLNVYSFDLFIKMFIARIILKIIVVIFSTPAIYIANKIENE